jgi:two-component system sensor kinase FixL
VIDALTPIRSLYGNIRFGNERAGSIWQFLETGDRLEANDAPDQSAIASARDRIEDLNARNVRAPKILELALGGWTAIRQLRRSAIRSLTKSADRKVLSAPSSQPFSRQPWVEIASLVLASLLTLASIMAVYLNLDRMRESLELVQHTNEALLKASIMDGDAVQVESAERAYLLTADEEFRDDFTRLRNSLPGQLESLRLVGDNPQQQRRLDQVKLLLDARFRQLDEAVGLGPAQLAAALALVRRANKEQLTTQIRDQLAAFRQAEANLLIQRQRKAELGIVRSIELATVTMIFALTSAALVVWLFQRSRAAQVQRELATDLVNLSRIDVMGRMASMLAHELGQPITASGTYLRAVLRIIQSGRPATEAGVSHAAAQAVIQLDRARDIIQRLRDFIKQGEPTKTPVAVRELFGDAIALLGMGNADVAISTQLEEGLPLIFADKIQIEQVLINLMRNAVEAMVHSRSRSITLSAKRAGDSVLIGVSDTGPGIPGEMSRKLFQSIHTRKSSGMGVGLAICQTLINANGGKIWAENNPEDGASFYFTLPVVAPASKLSTNSA